MGKRTGHALHFCAAIAVFLLAGFAPQRAPAREGGVLQYHNGADRQGLYVASGLTYSRAAHLRLDPGFHAEVQGAVYAQPLYWTPPDGGAARLIVATELNGVYALDARTGRVVWHRQLGQPVPLSRLPCGNIDPLGVTGTPVIDPGSRALYLDAMVNVHDQPRHRLFALSLEDGSILPGWPLDVQQELQSQGKAFDARVQNQRGALALLGGMLYVPYGGHFGDCGDYHGWVIGVSVHNSSPMRSWATRARGGGIWAPGGIVAKGHELYVATGNTFGARQWSGGDAVVRLSPGLGFSQAPRDFFAPKDWRRLDALDLDLGGTNPLPFDLPGAQPPHLLLALGKDANAYLLDRDALGGIGGSLRVLRVARSSIRTAPAAFASGGGVMAVFRAAGAGCPEGRSGDLTALAIRAGAPPEMKVVWCAAARGYGSPIVTTTDGSADPIVWIVGAEGDNRLHGFRGDTGDVVFDGGAADDGMGTVHRFQTPIVAAGRIYVAGDGRVYAFSYVP